MIKLRDKDFAPLQEILGVDEFILRQLDAANVLNTRGAIGLLIKRDYQVLRKSKVYLPKHIIPALAVEYGVSDTYVKRILYNSVSASGQKYCASCGRPITLALFKSGRGRCKSCVTKKIIAELDSRTS